MVDGDILALADLVPSPIASTSLFVNEPAALPVGIGDALPDDNVPVPGRTAAKLPELLLS